MIDTALVPAYTAAAVRAAEAPLLEAGAPLMREAAAALAAVTREVVGERAGTVLVLAGSGDNGGDALYAAADLAADHAIEIVLTSDRAHRAALDAALAAGAVLRGAGELCDRPDTYTAILDGILGIGAAADARLRGVARGVVEALIPVVRDSSTIVIAVDLPSGLHPDDGDADAAVLAAAITVTFGAVKAGLVRGRGRALTGEIRLVDLGLGPALDRVRPVTGPVPVTSLARAQRA